MLTGLPAYNEFIPRPISDLEKTLEAQPDDTCDGLDIQNYFFAKKTITTNVGSGAPRHSSRVLFHVVLYF